MVEITATPYVPGQVHGPISRDPGDAGSILLVSGDALPPDSRSAGYIVVEGAMFSHPMLGVLAQGIPTVIVTAAQAAGLRESETILLDGYTGLLKSIATETPAAPEPPGLPSPGQAVLSADGVAVALRASVRNATGAGRAKRSGAESIGLVRTEFLEPDVGRQPDRAFYLQAFDALLAAADPLDVTLRLIDIASDKLPVWMSGSKHTVSTLGQQGIRLFGEEPLSAVVSAQLLAIADRGLTERIRLLVPYITTLEEMRRTRDAIRKNIELPVGAMIETPAAALEIAGHLEIADFVALGTNDLMQSLFAADRDDPAVQSYLDPYAPVLYRFLAQIAREAGDRLRHVQVCGLLSQLPGVLPVMLGLGFRAFSVDAAYIPYLAATVRGTHVEASGTLAGEVCAMKGSAAVRGLLGVNAITTGG